MGGGGGALLSQLVKSPESEGDYSDSSRAKVKVEWNCISILVYAFMAHRDNFTFLLNCSHIQEGRSTFIRIGCV